MEKRPRAAAFAIERRRRRRYCRRNAVGGEWTASLRGLAAKGALLLAILVLLVAALATYQIVTTLFFVPLLAAIVFSEAKAGGAAMLRAAAGAALLFLVAAIIFLLAHRILLLDHGYFFMLVEQVRGAAVAERTVTTVTSFADAGAKLAFLAQLMPRLLSLWFISEHYPVHPVMPWVFGAATLTFLAHFVRRTANAWRILALLLVTACFFGPFALSHNAGDGLYQLERVKALMQVPVVLFLWALIQWLFAGGSWLLPTYMELKHAEPRLREAVRRDIKHIYIFKTEDNHLRAAIGVPGGDEFGRITSFYFPHQMVYAILLEIERRGTARAVVDVDADKTHTIPAGGPEKLVLDMRKFP